MDMNVFQGIAGYDQEKRELQELMDILSNKKRYTSKGISIPNGLLISGNPGNGKTMFANKMINGLNKKVIIVGPEEVYGDASTKIKSIYEQARNSNEETIIYIDELDTLVMEDHGQFDGMNNRVISQLLIELDKSSNSNIFTILISNRPYTINPALLRSGRVDIKIDIRYPNKNNRRELLKYYLKSQKYDQSQIENLVNTTKNLSCSDIQNMVSKSILFSMRRESEVIEQQDFEEAISRIAFKGLGRENDVSKKSLRRIATHEIGHSLLTYLVDKNNFGMVTLMNWGKSLGHTRTRIGNSQILTEYQYINMMAVAIGGRAAEDILYDNTSTLSSDDLQKLYHMASEAVKSFGFKNIYLVSSNEPYSMSNDSQQRLEKIEELTMHYISEAKKRAYNILEKHEKELINLRELLIDKKTLYISDFDQIMKES